MSQKTQDMNILTKHIFRDQSKYSRYEYFDQFKIRIIFGTSQNTQDTNILTKHHSIMTQARFAGRGQNSGCAGCGPGNGRGQGRGRGTGYTSKPKTSKVGLPIDPIFDLPKFILSAVTIYWICNVTYLYVDMLQINITNLLFLISS